MELVMILCSMVFGAGVMFAVMRILYLEKTIMRLKRKVKRLKSEPEIVKVIDVTPKEGVA